MKTLFGSILAFALFFASFDTIHAQTTTKMGPAVAFVKASRDTLFIQPLGVDSPVQAYDLASLFTNFTNGAVTINSINDLAVIGMTPDGAHLVIAATVNYINPSNSASVTFQGLLSIPWPITTFTLQNTVNFLLSSRGNNTFRPVGILSADGKQYWITFTSTSGGNDSLAFYHGNTNGTGTIDSTIVFEMEEGFEMSNIALDKTNNFMIATTYDKVLDADELTNGRFIYHAWQAGHGDEDPVDLSGAYYNIASAIYYRQIDSMFGLTVIPVNDGINGLLGLTSNTDMDNSINFYSVPYASSGADITNTNESPLSLQRTIIPSDEDFFSGQSCGLYQEQLYSAEKAQMGEAGDVSVNAIGGDSVLFVTHESPETDNPTIRDKYASIYYYDYTAGAASATLVYNDPSGTQPLQPVWVVAPYTTTTTVPVYYPGLAWQTSIPSYDFGSVDVGNTSSPATFNFTDTSSEKAVTLDSANITGANASEFSIVSGKVSGTLQPLANRQIIVSFTPVAPAGSVSATLNVYFEGQTSNMSITQALTGTVVVPSGGGGVQQDAVLASSLSIDPNPFTTSASIQLTSPSAGAMSIVVHDALGRTVYTSDLRETGAGQTESFTFDAKSLGLPCGVYYVTAFLGERQASRAVVFVR